MNLKLHRDDPPRTLGSNGYILEGSSEPTLDIEDPLEGPWIGKELDTTVWMQVELRETAEIDSQNEPDFKISFCHCEGPWKSHLHSLNFSIFVYKMLTLWELIITPGLGLGAYHSHING